MEIEYRILNLYRCKFYDECFKLFENADIEGNRLLEFVKLRVSTILAKIAGDGYEEVVYDSHQNELTSTAVAKTPRPGTTFSQRASVSGGPAGGPAPRQYTSVTGTVRRQTGATASRTRTALRTAARASRAATATAAEYTTGAPLTLSVITQQDKHFHVAAKTLYEYVFYCEGDVRKALEIGLQANKPESNPDWWWDYAVAKCYNSLGMHRSAEQSLRLALRKGRHITIFLRLVAMYVEINQPLSALEICKQGLSIFPEDCSLNIEQARIHEEMGFQTLAIQDYRRVAIEDATNIEATANIAMFNFYNDQPEMALRYYRRLLATSPSNAEIYNNLGLCCLYCNQWDLTLACFRHAFFLTTEPNIRADIWYNLTHIAISTGDLQLAARCLQLSLAMNSNHKASKHALKLINEINANK